MSQVQIQNLYPLAPMQEGMLYHHMLEPDSDAYFQQNVVVVDERLEVDLLRRSLEMLVKRYDVFRTVFVYKDEERPLQVVLSDQETQFYYEDFRGLSEEEKLERFEAFKRNDRRNHFDLEADGLIRLTVIEWEDERFKLVWSFPHIIMDGWCLGIIATEFFEVYQALKQSLPIQLGPVYPYSKYIQWLGEQSQEEALDYWRNYVGCIEEETTLPGRKIGNLTEEKFDLKEVSFTVDEILTDSMVQLARMHKVTLSTVFQAVWGLLLQKYNGSRDIVFGTVVSGRPDEVVGVEDMVGLFINTIPVKVDAVEGDTFAAILSRVQSAFIDSNRYSYMSLADIQAGSMLKQKLIQHIIVFENYPISDEIMGKEGEEESRLVNITGFEGFEQTNYDFDVLIAPGRTLEISFRYNAARYEADMVRRMSTHLIELIQQVVLHPELAVDRYEIVAEEERKLITNMFNNTAAEYPDQTTIVGQFEQVVAAMPEQVAVVFDDAQLTYQELNLRTNQAARRLQQLGVEPDQIVAVMMERSVEMPIALLAILKAGGAYLPIDPTLPEERIRYMLQDSGANVIVTQQRFEYSLRQLLARGDQEGALANEELTSLNSDISLVIADQGELYQGDSSNLPLAAESEHLAYVIYTSGTTGNPKGVMIEHRSLVNRLHWMQKQYPIGAADVILQKTPYNFDVSVWEQFWWAIQGATVVFLQPDGEKDPGQIVEAIARHHVTTMHFVPSMLSVFLEYMKTQQEAGLGKLESLRHVFASGEALNVEVAERFNSLLYRGGMTKLINLYGPTEATIDVSYFDCSTGDSLQLVPIGRPIDNTELFVVSNSGTLQPIGVPGELCIAGVQLARGYLNRSELTAEKFVPIPFRADERMYRTGDLARWLPDGNIEYLGRIDHQVKIRGYRIELGEIEAVLRAHSSVKEAVVLDRQDAHGEKYLCAYVVAHPANLPDVSELREHLIRKLPSYMVPMHYVFLDTIPLTANGKMDRRALPTPEGGVQAAAEYVAPRNVFEVQLVRIWQEVLGIHRVGVTDNFFDIGGHSLRATTLIVKIHKDMNWSLSLRDIFQFPTIAQLADLITGREKQAHVSIPVIEESDYYAVSSAQKRLFILNQIEGAELNYNMPGAMSVAGTLDVERLKEAFRTLIDRHDTLRTSFEIVNGEPVQRVHAKVDFAMEFTKAEGAIEDNIREFVRPFEFHQPPLMRAAVIEMEQDQHILLFDMHHIISDGVSLDVLTHELFSLYRDDVLPPLRIQYKDYAAWQLDDLQTEQRKQQESFWLDVFQGEIPVLNMPTDFVRPAIQRFEGDSIEFVIGKQRSERLRQLAAHTGSTLYMVLLAAYTALLHKYTGQEDVIVGTPIAGRPHADLERLIGMFVNTLALRTRPSGDKTFYDYVMEIKEHALEAYENQDYPFEELVEKLNVRRDLGRQPLFDTMFVLQNTEETSLSMEGVHWKPYPTGHTVAKFDLIFQANEQGEDLVCSFDFATSLYTPESMQRMSQHLLQLIDVILDNPQAKLSSVDMITPEERIQIIEVFNDTAAEYPDQTTIVGQFEHVVATMPEQVAVVFDDAQLTYQELNLRTNQAARRLQQLGVQPDQIVAVMMERSAEMSIALLSILKAGGAYLPIDPALPEERIRYMLQDSGANVIVTQQRFEHSLHQLLARGDQEGALANEELTSLNSDISLVIADQGELYQGDSSNLPLAAESEHLAYVIYTSGTTGNPKGVMIEHCSLVNRLHWMQKQYPIGAADVILQKTPYNFDVSVWEQFWWAIQGATVVFLQPGGEKDPGQIVEAIARHHVTTMHFVPSMLSVFLEYIKTQQEAGLGKLESLRHVFASGEALNVEVAERFNSLLYRGGMTKLINLYGPTEATIDVSYFDCSTGEQLQILPIGRPIDNTELFVVSNSGTLQPIGVPGELCIAGVQLARGYLNRPELSVEKFVPIPFRSHERMYRTGDLARWLPNGNIEYLGRIDHQVKIRGYRIELGEVETQLLNVEAVREAVVIPRADEAGQLLLCAYFAADTQLTAADLRSSLVQQLPTYMIPSFFVQLDHIPLTSNGKVDRKALSLVEGNFASGTEYVAPRTLLEQLLTSVWQAVLGVEAIGIQDNFFELGGDSIKSIQVSSRLHQAGYKLEMKHMFKNATIAELSQYVQPLGIIADQGEVKGQAELTPIQHWFFEQHFTDQHHFNQAVMLYREQRFEEAALRKALRKIAEHHDGLRMVFRRTEQGYMAWNRGIDEGELYHFEMVDFKGAEDCSQAIADKASEIQGSIELTNGPLMKIILFRCVDGDHLLIAIHHLAVDGVSWRILFEDLATGYEQAVKGQDIQLPNKTNSFQLWAEQLSAYANSSAMKNERKYWSSICNIDVPSLPRDFNSEPALLRDIHNVSVKWTQEETEKLLKHAHRAYNTDMNDLLLTALGIAIHDWSGVKSVLLNLEGHGREEILADIDINRTVGWFTSQYPVVLDMDAVGDLSFLIKSVKENLHQIPSKGIGYGIVKYLSDQAEDIGCTVEPEISFNYLGQFDQDLNQNELTFSSYSSGAAMSQNMTSPYVLEINGMVVDGALEFTFSYSHKQYHMETIEKLAGLFRSKLQAIIAHCAAQERTERTPSDFLITDMSLQELEQLTKDTAHLGPIENVYPLTPMQKGMQFHTMMEPNSGAYFEQMTFTIEGNLNVDLFEKSLEQLTQRHDVLRTNFYAGWNGQAIQVVFQNSRIRFCYEDLRTVDEHGRQHHFDKLVVADRVKGFDLSQDELMRMSVVRTGETTYQFIWSFHHILMDGWCLFIVANEVFSIYEAILQNKEPALGKAWPYRQYFEWLAQQDSEAAGQYWANYLAGYEHQTLIPQAKTGVKAEEYAAQKVVGSLGKELTQRIQRAAKNQQVTVNTLIQTAWGILLQAYNDTDDVVFGNVVSGRPAEIPGIETMLGLFINTIPVRIRCEESSTVAEVMRKVQDQAIASQAYESYPLYEIQAMSNQKQGLIDHIIVFENYPVDQNAVDVESDSRDKLDISNIEVVEQTNYDLNLIVVPDEEIVLRMEYNASIYDQASIEQIKNHLIHIMDQIATNPHASVKELELITKEEEYQLLEVFNNSTVSYAASIGEKTIQQLFEEQVDRIPNRVAIVHHGNEITYRQLNEQANRLARTLRAEGVEDNQLVCIMAERSPELIIGILATLKAGGAYVPIDPEYPLERVHYMLQDSGANVLLLHEHWSERVVFDGKKLELENVNHYHEDDSNLIPVNLSDDLAYVIYTSGTTGRPKGVMVEHRSLVNLCNWHQKEYSVSHSDRSTLYAGVGFDASAWEIFPYLLVGASIYVVDSEIRLDPFQLNEFMNRNQISISFLPTQLCEHFMELDNRSLRVLLTGGDRLQRYKPKQYELYNNYGPTENTVVATFCKVDGAGGTIPIGKPIDNCQVYILNSQHQLQPIGVTGELYIAGIGLARGYWNQPELTEERFLANPFVADERMYRTGDLARWLPDGSIVYAGRSDHQVKIRGFRIELGEIEAQLLQHHGVKDSVVIVHELRGEKILCAYYSVSEGEEIRVTALKEQLAAVLPAYMMPLAFMELPQLPLTTNGKIDRKALPLPELGENEEDYAALDGVVEERLAYLWKELLGVERVGAEHNFFEIGGHSLHASVLLSRINKEFNVALPLRVLFEAPTLRDQAERIQKAAPARFKPLEPVEKRALYPITSSQKRLLIINDLQPGNTTYNVPSVLEINDTITPDTIEYTLNKLIERHEVFRTSFELSAEQYYQRVHDHVPFELTRSDLGAGKTIGEERVVLEDKMKAFVRPFDLTVAPLLRAELVSIGDKKYLLLDMHHTIADGVSSEIMTAEFQAICKGVNPAEPRIQYKDYAVWLDELTTSGAMERDERFWLQTYANDIPVLALPTDYRRPSVQSHEGAGVSVTIEEADVLERIHQVATETGTTVFMVLLSVYQVLLHRYTGQDDIIIGTPVAGRSHADVQRTLGMFVNTLALRGKPESSKSFNQVLMELKDHMLQAFDHQMYPFEELLDKLKLQRDVSRHPLFDTLFTLRSSVVSQSESDDRMPFKAYDLDTNISKFDLSLFAEEHDQSLRLEMEYATKLFRNETVERMLEHYVCILKSALANINQPIDSLTLLADKEFAQIIAEFNQTRTDYPQQATIHGLFEEQAIRTPDHIAICEADTVLTYQQLNEQAACWAHQLIALGVDREEPIGLMTGRSAAAVIGMLGILKAGCSYLPIDPTYPDERIQFMLEDGGVKLLLAEAQERMQSIAYSGTILKLTDVPSASAVSTLPTATAKQLAYVMYTSGSTGKPKGVMVEHRNVVRLVQNTNYVSFEEHDRILLTGNIVFDACTFEIWGALLNGLQLHIVPEQVILDSEQLEAVIRTHEITTMWLTSPLFNQHAQHRPHMFAPLRQLLVGGDVLSPGHIRNVKQQCPELNIINGYGPTENTTFSCCFLIEEEYSNIPIGSPIANSTVYIMNSQHQLQPVGVPGEIGVGGDGVARGYLNQEQLTEDKFIPNPFVLDERLYLTGDLGRWLPDGTIEYLGRIDHQVKIRGYRIELGEIEKQLLDHEEVNEALVIAVGNEDRQSYLCAYVASDTNLSAVELKTYLGSQLPDYMVPVRYVMLERMPLTANGKIDRRALPTPEAAQIVQQQYEAPRNEIERELVALWQEVLEVERIGIHDNFFELGGHSLKAIQIVSGMRMLGVSLNLNQLFQEQSISKLSRILPEIKQVEASKQVVAVTSAEAEQLLLEHTGRVCRFVVEEHRTSAPSSGRELVRLDIQAAAISDQERDQLIEFITARVHQSLHPHRIQALDESAAAIEHQEVMCEGSGTDDSIMIAERLGKLASEQLASMYQSIVREPIAGTQPLAGIQRYHLLHPDFSGTVLDLDRYIRTDMLSEAIRLLMDKHDLLRCTLSTAADVPQWVVRETPQKIVIPVVDLSPYPSALSEEVLMKLSSMWLYEPYDTEAGLPLYRVFLVKLNLRENVLVLPFSHMIFDYMSSDLIGRELLQLYEHLERGTSLPTVEYRSYHEYSAQLSRGPQGMNEQQLLEKMNLHQYADNADTVAQMLARKEIGKPTKFSWTLEWENDQKPTAELMWQVAYCELIQICSTYFGVDQVPVWVTHFGRHYEQATFYNMIGEFIDQIPILACSSDDPESLVAAVKERMDMAVQHNINVMSLMYDDQLAQQYAEASELLRKSLEGMPVIFNYVGESVLGELGQVIEHAQHHDTEFNDRVIMFTARTSGEQLNLSLVLPFVEQFEWMEQLIKFHARPLGPILKHEVQNG
ncbi:amino acid adenylation domain-containing protein [Paenibacillus sp. SC116]|uniref:non-ribosomal peptide synthetase n=1 Tax=Paenibacillus sp. SC116 TaxID=2968986 RepID=UPI00215AA491|nr:non-ribosomal peptide synthetase [Paenibacillus sp. SC116]MCR8843449.1 amino acid adenylation domain-containing protein [Paenibacillus sp. SC116]